MKKARLSVYLDKAALDGLANYAARRNISLSLTAESAIAAFVDTAEQNEATIRRLGRLERTLQRIERDHQISMEALMLFVWSWFAAHPHLPDPDPAIKALTTARYDNFMEMLGQRLAYGEDSKRTSLTSAVDSAEGL